MAEKPEEQIKKKKVKKDSLLEYDLAKLKLESIHSEMKAVNEAMQKLKAQEQLVAIELDQKAQFILDAAKIKPEQYKGHNTQEATVEYKVY